MKSRIHYQTFVISISLGKGCYRHIRISGRETLEELSDSILWAFDFDNDHLHAFYMNNRAWDQEACYISRFAEGDRRTTDKYTIQSVGLEVGQKFLYIFDFGDEWHFECKVLKILDEETKETELIRIKGKAPEQYPEYDADEYAFEELKELPVPVPDSLYATAFQFRAEKLWKKLYDNQIFAVQLSDNQIGYCTVMGALGEHFALGLYIGEEGFRTYQNIAAMPEDISGHNYFDFSISQNCLQCSFENKDDIQEAERISVQTYTKANHIRLRGANSFPVMLCSKSYQVPWFVSEEKDYRYLEEALKAGLEVAEKLKSHQPKELGFSIDAEDIPLLIPDGEGFIWGMCHLPELNPETFVTPVLSDELIEKVKSLKKINKLECRLMHIHNPVQESPEEAPYFPAILLAMETRNERMLKTQPVKRYAGNEYAVLEDFALNLIAAKRIPKSIAVIDDRTEALLSAFCQACTIELKRVKEFTKLQEVEKSVNGGDMEGGFSRFMQMIDTVKLLPEEALKDMPEEWRDILMVVGQEGMLPPETVEKMKRAWNT